jgi:hypothetical protein
VTASPAPLDASRPHVARVYDYLLGGKDNFAADRTVGDRMLASIPAVQLGVRAQRDVLGRVVRYLNVHEIAQRIDPATRVVYLDNDPIVLSHAEALLADDKSTFVVEGDLRDPAGILSHPDVRKHLDWEQPIGLLMCGILHYILDEEHPGDVVATLYRALPPGSYVFIHHLLSIEDPAAAVLQDQMRTGLGRAQFRTMNEVRELFDGLALVEPGLVLVPDWRPEPPAIRDHPVLEMACVGVARKL